MTKKQLGGLYEFMSLLNKEINIMVIFTKVIYCKWGQIMENNIID